MSDNLTEHINNHDNFINSKIHEKLVSMARSSLNKGFRGNTLETHDVLNDSILKFYASNRKEFESRNHFYATMSTIMRNLIIDHVRKKQATINGGNKIKMTLSHLDQQQTEQSLVDIMEMEVAITKIGKSDKDLEEIIVIRFFGGASIEELAEIYDTSISSIKRKLRFARAMLKRELG